MEHLYPWSKLIHTIGFAFWIGSLAALSRLLTVETSHVMTGARRQVALLGDIMCTLAIVGGLGLIFSTRHHGDAWPMKQGWMHAKLLAVVLLLGLHGFLRVKVKKLASSQEHGPAWAFFAVLLLAVAVIFLAVRRPF